MSPLWLRVAGVSSRNIYRSPTGFVVVGWDQRAGTMSGTMYPWSWSQPAHHYRPETTFRWACVRRPASECPGSGPTLQLPPLLGDSACEIGRIANSSSKRFFPSSPLSATTDSRNERTWPMVFAPAWSSAGHHVLMVGGCFAGVSHLANSRLKPELQRYRPGSGEIMWLAPILHVLALGAANRRHPWPRWRAGAIYWRQTLFSIPFHVERPDRSHPEPVEVQLYVSPDRGGRWDNWRQASPQKGYFLFKAGRTANTGSMSAPSTAPVRLHPQGQHTPKLIVIVDTFRQG